MSEHEVHVEFSGRIILIGFGSVGQGVLPLILRHIGIHAERLAIVTADDAGHDEAEITVEGDAGRVRGRTSGTLPDGTTIGVRTNTLLTIADGVIVALQSDMDAPSTEAWQKVLVVGGFEVPPRTATG